MAILEIETPSQEKTWDRERAVELEGPRNSGTSLAIVADTSADGTSGPPATSGAVSVRAAAEFMTSTAADSDGHD